MPGVIRSFTFPVPYMRMMSYFDILSLTFPGNCVRRESRYSYYDSLILATLGPVLLTLAFVVVGVVRHIVRRAASQYATQSIRRPRGRRRGLFSTMKNVAMRSWVIICFMCYPLTAYIVLSCFAIDKFDDPGATSYDESKKLVLLLRTDPSERGEGNKYNAWRVYAVFCVATHVLGIPLSFAIALFRKHDILDPVSEETGMRPRIDPDDRRSTRQVVDAAAAGRDHNSAVANTRPLWSVYRPAYYFWEVVESLRRMAFTCIPLLVSSNKTPASLAALVVVGLAMCSTMMYRQHRPFLQENDDNLYEGLMWSLLVLSLLIFARTTDAMDNAGSSLDVLLVLTVPFLLGFTLYVVFRDLSNEKRAVEILRHEISQARETFTHKVAPTARRMTTALTTDTTVRREPPESQISEESPGGPGGSGERDEVLLVAHDGVEEQ
mmetsp:Transcript_11833/g.35533  ORF Transcript_11833/g.35533 Transcript_11833/m.35533 type:complete len:436 (+) Transcript_11833:505-1812(+)